MPFLKLLSIIVNISCLFKIIISEERPVKRARILLGSFFQISEEIVIHHLVHILTTFLKTSFCRTHVSKDCRAWTTICSCVGWKISSFIALEERKGYFTFKCVYQNKNYMIANTDIYVVLSKEILSIYQQVRL